MASCQEDRQFYLEHPGRQIVMEQELNHEPQTDAEAPSRSVADNIRELTESSKQLLDAGKQVTDNLSELSQRMEHASAVSSRVFKNPWMIAGAAIAAGALIVAFSRNRAAY
ncbi:MAG TPA: hypothetical protein VHZ07_00355 [Bryobacteraceae bacterium]|jgi:hypothetical protein|nr:hypothetical protein [Bryobacteraceae bacterium]